MLNQEKRTLHLIFFSKSAVCSVDDVVGRCVSGKGWIHTSTHTDTVTILYDRYGLSLFWSKFSLGSLAVYGMWGYTKMSFPCITILFSAVSFDREEGSVRTPAYFNEFSLHFNVPCSCLALQVFSNGNARAADVEKKWLQERQSWEWVKNERDESGSSSAATSFRMLIFPFPCIFVGTPLVAAVATPSAFFVPLHIPRLWIAGVSGAKEGFRKPLVGFTVAKSGSSKETGGRRVGTMIVICDKFRPLTHFLIPPRSVILPCPQLLLL